MYRSHRTDTNNSAHITALEEPYDEAVKEKLANISDNLYITPLLFCELYRGVYLSSKPSNDLQLIDALLASTTLLEFDKVACKIFGQEFARLQKAGKTTEEPNLMIASIAKANYLILVTRNKKHFENINVKLEIW